MAAKKNSVTYNGTGRRKTSVARVFMTRVKVILLLMVKH